jgi:hypothetical protein
MPYAYHTVTTHAHMIMIRTIVSTVATVVLFVHGALLILLYVYCIHTHNSYHSAKTLFKLPPTCNTKQYKNFIQTSTYLHTIQCKNFIPTSAYDYNTVHAL